MDHSSARTVPVPPPPSIERPQQLVARFSDHRICPPNIFASSSSLRGCGEQYMSQPVANPYFPAHKIRLVTAASLFDGHDAAINIMRRIIPSASVEVIES
ncbi:MAG: hypothetical protein KBF67_14495 [Flavobacteriales bacterium]|nr:hypothetical protein [Flavobacteriales bacterium]